MKAVTASTLVGFFTFFHFTNSFFSSKMASPSNTNLLLLIFPSPTNGEYPFESHEFPNNKSLPGNASAAAAYSGTPPPPFSSADPPATAAHRLRKLLSVVPSMTLCKKQTPTATPPPLKALSWTAT